MRHSGLWPLDGGTGHSGSNRVLGEPGETGPGHVFPYPLGPITDDAQAHLLCRNQACFFDLLEGLAELRLILHLMPTQHMDNALTIQQIKAKALGVAPLPPPPRPFGPRASWPLLGLSGAVGTRRHIGASDAQHHHRTAKAP